MAQPVEIDPAFEIDRHMAVRRDRPVPAPMRLEMLGTNEVRRERVRNIHGNDRLEVVAIDCIKGFSGSCQECAGETLCLPPGIWRIGKSFWMAQKSRAMTGKGGRSAPASRPTIKDVAERCGVHPSTVSRALSPAMSHLVAPEVAKRIRAAAAALHYQPNVTAAGLRTGRSRPDRRARARHLRPRLPADPQRHHRDAGRGRLCDDRRRRRAQILAGARTGR